MSERLRILIVAPEYPYPPFASGNRLMLYHLLKRLHERHRFTLLCYTSEEVCAEPDPVAEWCNVRLVPVTLEELWAKRRTMASRFFGSPLVSAQMTGAIRAALRAESYDVVHVHTSAMAPYGRVVGPIPSLLYAIDAKLLLLRGGGLKRLSGGLRPALGWLQDATRMVSEVRDARRFNAVVYVGEADAQAHRVLSPHDDVRVIPNGIEAEYYFPRQQPTDGCQIVFTGVMDYGPNVEAVTWFARHVLPSVRVRRPDAAFAIVGMCPAPAVSALAQLPGVAVVGRVEDVRPYLWGSRVFVCPLRSAAGLQNKVLQAMSVGLPVVGTPVSFRGVTRRVPPPGCMMARTPKEFASAVIALCMDRGRAADMGRAARRFVTAQFTWARCADHYDKVCRDISSLKSQATKGHLFASQAARSLVS